MRELTEKEKIDLKNSLKSNLEKDFIENYNIWKSSLDDVNRLIEDEIKKILLVSPFYKDLLYTYNELCTESLLIVDDLEFKNSHLDPSNISREITQKVTYNRLYLILKNYI